MNNPSTINFEQKRLDNIQYSGVSGLSSLPKAESMPDTKQPLFYLIPVSVNDYEDDLYFVNNSDETLRFVAPFELYRNKQENGVVFNGILADDILADDPLANVANPLSTDVNDTLSRAKLYERDISKLYTEVLPKQAVKIDTTHIIYDSDGLNQWIIHVAYKTPETDDAIWRFNVVTKGAINQPYPLLWDDYSQPSGIVSSEPLITQEWLEPFKTTHYKN